MSAAEPHVAAGLVAAQRGDLGAALAAFDRAVAADSRHARAHDLRAIALTELGRLPEALLAYDRALACAPGAAESYLGRGDVLCKLGRYAEALAAYDRAALLGVSGPAMAFNRAEALAELDRNAEALAGYQAALADIADLVPAHYGAARMLWRLGQPGAALEAARRAVMLEPRHAGAHNIAGLALHALGRKEEALAAYERAIAGDPSYPDAYGNRGSVLRELRRFEEAAASLEAALARNPRMAFAAGQLLQVRRHMADWTDHDATLAPIAAGAVDVLPFTLLALVDDPALHRRTAAAHLARACSAPAAPLPPHPPGDRIRLGYFSADFHAHAMLFLTMDALEAHDRARFEITCYSFGLHSEDEWRARAVAAADRFIDVTALSDAAIAALSREHQIDIAVDLAGLSGGCRPDIFAHRAAPVQVSWLGYPGSCPAPWYDYAVVEPIVIPPAEREWMAERRIVLPDNYMPCRRITPLASAPARSELELPEDGVVFCCFNQAYKITPDLFARWMRILAAVPGSVLWLWGRDGPVRANLGREAAAKGIDPARLVFAPSLPLEEHLARLQQADLFLDTAPYNAHTTATDALRAGVPLLTVPGRSFASRVAASLVSAAGVPELICASWDEYEARAIALGQDSAARAALRARLDGRADTPLFDPVRFIRHLEAGLIAAVERSRRGEVPQDIVVG